MVRSSHFVMTLIACASLSACTPQPANDASAAALIAEIDLLQLPNRDWQVSAATLQLSFCRNRVNTALLAEPGDLNRWRLTGEVSAFPDYRAEGLNQVANLYHEHGVLLYQEWGTQSSQFYRIAYPYGETEPSVFDALARLGRDDTICFSALDNTLAED